MAYFNLTVPAQPGTVINFQDVIRQSCELVDSRVVMFMLIIFTFYTMNNVVIPRVRGIAGPALRPVWDMILDKYISMNETLALGGAVLIVILRWVQGMSWPYKAWFVSMIGITVLAFMTDLIRWKREGKRPQYVSETARVGGKLKEAWDEHNRH